VLRIALPADPGHNVVRPEGPAVRVCGRVTVDYVRGMPTVVPHGMSFPAIIRPEGGMMVRGRCVGTGGVRRRDSSIMARR
jgi:hypothetical protein